MIENSEMGMKSLRLSYNNEFFDILVDEETYQQLICDKNLQNEYARAVYESNISSSNKGPVTASSSLQTESDLQPPSQSLLDPKAYLSNKCTILDTSQSHHENNVFKWNNDTIKLLLNIRLGMEKEFCMPSCKKRKLWNKVAAELNEVIGSNQVSADICDTKYRNLLGTYRVNKRKQNSTGEGVIKWEFFEIMDETLGYKASSAPPSSFLGATMDLNSSDLSLEENKNSEDDETTSELDTSLGTSPVHSKKKNKEELSLKKYLFLQFQKDSEKQHEQKEREDKKWKEKKELKLKEIEAINNLAAAIASSTNK